MYYYYISYNDLTTLNSNFNNNCCIDVSSEFSISSLIGLDLTALFNPKAKTISIDVFGYGSYPNANIEITIPSKYANSGNWDAIPCGKGYKIDGTFVEVTASLGLKSITFFYNVNISIDRLMLHLTYKIA